MRRGKWLVTVLALGMMAATAGWLATVPGRVKLGAPGVRVEPLALFGADGMLVSNRMVVLPAQVAGFESQPGLITADELTGLPEDTTFGRRIYTNRDIVVQLSVVLMGTDHTSIHMPQYCLYAQDWTVTNQERIALHIERPYAYDIPAMKLSAIHSLTNGQALHCLYIYWFVSGDKITAEEGARLGSMWKTQLATGVTERWAYISYFATCLAGEEAVTFERLQELIKVSVPEFQTVTGESTGALAPRTVNDGRAAGAGGGVN